MGIEKEDPIEIQFAQTILDGPLLLHTKQKKESAAIESTRVLICKKKQLLITALLKV